MIRRDGGGRTDLEHSSFMNDPAPMRRELPVHRRERIAAGLAGY